MKFLFLKKQTQVKEVPILLIQKKLFRSNSWVCLRVSPTIDNRVNDGDQDWDITISCVGVEDSCAVLEDNMKEINILVSM